MSFWDILRKGLGRGDYKVKLAKFEEVDTESHSEENLPEKPKVITEEDLLNMKDGDVELIKGDSGKSKEGEESGEEK